MSRLYYEPEKPNPLQPKAVGGKKKNKAYNYLEKVSRMIPAEVLAAYLTIFGFADLLKSPHGQNLAHWVIWFVCLAATPAYLFQVADKGKPKVIHLIFSTVAFIAWSYATTGKTLQDTIWPGTYEPAVASICVGLLSLILGLFRFKV